MSDEKKKPVSELEEMAQDAEALELEAKQETDVAVYTHKLKKAITWEDKTYEELTFQWDKLTGTDHLAIEAELMMRGQTLVLPEYTGEFLCRMAARACTGPLPVDVIKKLPIREFQTICKKARSFLLRAGS